ncbi:MAG: TlpA family protein disulfide reductase [bacterium]|nr:TlpA family protein disulfide reductase [bacterium]
MSASRPLPLPAGGRGESPDSRSPRSWRTAAWVAGGVVAVLVLAALGWGLLHPSGGTSTTTVVGRAAPDLAMRTLDGQTVRLSDYAGRPVVVNFWASWCAPCRQEEGALKQAAARWQGKVQFLGVDFRDSPEGARAAQERAQYPYPVGPATDGAPQAYGVASPPETYFLDAGHTVVARFLGPLDGQALDRHLQLMGVRT